MDTCAAINEVNAYIPVTIVGIIASLILVALRAYSSKKMGNESRRSKMYTGSEDRLNYKINLLRVGAVLFTYLEIIACIVIAAKNSSYSISTGSTTVILIGLVMHILSNVAFAVGYCCIVQKNRVVAENGEEEKEEEVSVRHRIVMVLSVVITFRSYKLLFSNLFVDRTRLGKNMDKNAYPSD